MLCLVTGATGFIGPHLIRSLHAEGHRVRVVARPESDIGVLPLNQVEVLEADLISGKSLRDALRGVEVVFHLAAPRRAVDPSTGKSRRPGNQDVIVKGTEALVAAVENEHSTRIVLTSTAHVYPEHSRMPVSEDAPTQPSTAYAKARLEAERIVRKLNNGRHGRYTIARLTSVYGTGDRQYVSLFRQIASGRFRLIGSGDQTHHMSFVDDVVRGFSPARAWAGLPDRRSILAVQPDRCESSSAPSPVPLGYSCARRRCSIIRHALLCGS